MQQIAHVPCENIRAGSNDRKKFNQTKLQELADSIEDNGLAQPITVRPIRAAGGEIIYYQIVAGERRFRAVSKLLGWYTIPAIVRELSDEQASAIMLAENTGREDLDPIEEANAYQDRQDRFGWSIERIAEKAGVSADLVKRRLSLRKLVPEVQHLVAFEQIPLGHAEAMTALDANRQRIALRIFQQSKGVPLAQFRQIIGELLAEQSQDSLFGLETFWVEQVQRQDIPRRGRHAVTGAPTRADLPPVEAKSAAESAAVVMDRWIAALLAQGLQQEAAVAGTLYDSLVRLNYLAVPTQASLLERGT